MQNEKLIEHIHMDMLKIQFEDARNILLDFIEKNREEIKEKTNQSDFDIELTLRERGNELRTQMMFHLPKEVLAKIFGEREERIANTRCILWIRGRNRVQITFSMIDPNEVFVSEHSAWLVDDLHIRHLREVLNSN
jgi:hypothetical protein